MAKKVSEHRVYRRFFEGEELFICRDCLNTKKGKEDPMYAVVNMGHGKLQ